jgi:hypothetical protein
MQPLSMQARRHLDNFTRAELELNGPVWWLEAYQQYVDWAEGRLDLSTDALRQLHLTILKRPSPRERTAE